MSMYPSLEDMKVDHMIQAQRRMETQYAPVPPSVYPSAEPSAPSLSPLGYESTTGHLYPCLGNYMGLELSEEALADNVPEYATMIRGNMAVDAHPPSDPSIGMIAPLSGNSLGLRRAQVTNGIRELTLCKDRDGKIGLRVHSVNSGIFVCLVSPNSPASITGLRFGDQILEINGTTVAGYTMDQVHKILRNAPVNGIKVVVRDRPLERTVTMHKDSSGNIGFHFKNGKIMALVKDSSAARNGLLTDHQILEVNGKNVVGLKDKDIVDEIARSTGAITVTVIPSYIYDHMIKNMAGSLLKTGMDHSVPSNFE